MRTANRHVWSDTQLRFHESEPALKRTAGAGSRACRGVLGWDLAQLRTCRLPQLREAGKL